MRIDVRGLLACALAFTLAACGGGSGGGSGPGASNPDGAWLTFDPAAPTVSQYEGESVPLSVTATSSRTFAQSFNIGIIDPKGVFTTEVSVSAASPMAYTATLHTARNLGAGTHTTSLEVRVCEDAPLTCAKPFPGSPWHVPVTVQVKSKAEAATRLTLSVPSVSVTTYPDEAASFTFEAQLSKELLTRYVNIGVFDPASLTVTPPDQLTIAPSGHYVFTLSTATSNALAVGTYTSNLQVRLCEDDVRTCQRPVGGSPWTLPLTVNVKSPTNMSALTPVNGLGSWTTYQGNAAHTGFVDATFDPATFTRRWQMPSASNYQNRFASTAVDGGRVFFVRHGSTNQWELVAVSEDTGALAWKVDLGNLDHVNPPAAANGHVYVTSTGHEDSYLWIYSQATGALLRQTAMSSQWSDYSAPTVFGTDVYSIDGYYGGIAKYADQAGKFAWRIGSTVEEGWSPATDGQFVYTYSTPDNILKVYNAGDGGNAYSIGAPYPNSTYFSASPVVLTSTGLAIVASGQLMAFDLATHTRAWVLDDNTFGMAAYGNGTVYAFGANGRTLEAHAPANGSLLWTADLGDSYFSNVIVTRNLAFVSSSTTTQAVDLNTRKVVWTYPQGGNLAISQRGVLYILTDIGKVAAVNLR
jgi:hypothetical protein